MQHLVRYVNQDNLVNMISRKISLGICISGILSMIPLSYVFAQPQVNPCPKGGTVFYQLCDLDLIKTVPTFLAIFLIIVAVASLTFLILGAYKWIMSEGDKTKLDEARGTLISAVLGLLFAFLALFIMNFLAQLVFGTKLTDLLKLPILERSQYLP